MARRQRELWANLQHPQWGGPVFPVVVTVEVEGTSTDTIPVFVATRNVAIRRAKFIQEVSPDGTKTLQLVNLTDTADLTDEVSSDGLAADTAASWTLTSDADLIEEDDVIGLEYTADVAGSTAPLEVTVVMELELLELKND